MRTALARIRGVLKRTAIPAALTGALVLSGGGPAGAIPQDAAGNVTGNAERGRPMFESYKCYACHGYEGETGSPRLVPMTLTQEAFIAYVRSPRTLGMPNYSSVPVQTLADIYAYIESITPDAPPAESIPLLNSVLEELEED